MYEFLLLTGFSRIRADERHLPTRSAVLVALGHEEKEERQPIEGGDGIQEESDIESHS